MTRAEPLFQQTEVFISGQDNVNIYRIPGLITTQKGTVLAFCEAREGGDQTPTDMVLKRSFDNGQTWGPMQIIIKHEGTQALMNPCPLIDQSDGTIYLFCNLFPKEFKVQRVPGAVRQLWTKSTDDGASWSDAVDITEQVTHIETWAGICSGPGVSIQTTTGRFIVPCWHFETGKGNDNFSSNICYSDDHGLTWHIGSNVAGYGDESQIVELADGTIIHNIRDCTTPHTRKVALSSDSGKTWSEPYQDQTLITPCCQASILRYTKISEGYAKNRILFSNPGSTKSRENLTVRISYDEGKSWAISKSVSKGYSGYSCLTVLPDNTIGVLYEAGGTPWRISYARFNLEWLSDGRDRLQPQALSVEDLHARALSLLRQGMREGKEWVKVHAAEELVWNGYPQDVRESFLDELAKNPGPKYRIGVWRVLAQEAGPGTTEHTKYINKIRAALLDRNGPDRTHAAEALGKLGFSEHHDEIIRIAGNTDKDQESGLREMARFILANSGDLKDEKYLAELLDSENADVRRGVAYGLRWQKKITRETRAKLSQATADEPVNSTARVYLLSTLYVHAPEIKPLAQLKGGLLHYAFEGNVEQKNELCQALSVRGDVTDLNVLQNLMADENLDVRINASNAVLKILRRDLGAIDPQKTTS
ncbi:MAG: exo-alpha-sialidase [Sedimentisphaerales bacterium]|nr:exo-alpha-sialidase [Sedimentisphaerales bacterium]